MNLEALINRYKQQRKQKLLTTLTQTYRKTYAVVGVGRHSMATIYPLLSFLSVPVKYILTRESSADKMAQKFPAAVATHDYQKLLSDPEVDGIFICSHPRSHYHLTLQALEAGKNVFVEKPVCHSGTELNQLITACKTHCIVGLQKRYSRINEILKRRLHKAVYYHARYATGAYPEGSPVYELFIHPVDNLVFLFGNAAIVYLRKTATKNGLLLTLHLEHQSGVHGVLELSTNHHWTDLVDNLRIETAAHEIKIHYPNVIESTPKTKTLLGMPLDKVFKNPIKREILYNNAGLEHTLEYNILFESGYYGQMKTFIDLTEGAKQSAGPSSLQHLVNTYALLDAIRNQL
jgi:virulence factor